MAKKGKKGKKGEKYEYHKQNEYPGERIAERERVEDRREAADKRSDARVARMKKKRNAADNLVMAVIVGLVVILLAVSVWGYNAMNQKDSEINSLNSQIGNLKLDNADTQTDCSNDITRPKVAFMSVSPANNEEGVSTHALVTVQFSEPMDAKTINSNTFILEQRTTPGTGAPSSEFRSKQIEGTVTYDGTTATFTPEPGETYNPLQPNEEYSNVFTATITTGVKDLEGNSLSQNYVWSFTTGGLPFNTGPTTSQTG